MKDYGCHRNQIVRAAIIVLSVRVIFVVNILVMISPKKLKKINPCYIEFWIG